MEEFRLNNHPTKDIKGQKSSRLKGKTICLCLTGSVSIINSPYIARVLIRHGAEVITVMSKEAMNLIQKGYDAKVQKATQIRDQALSDLDKL